MQPENEVHQVVKEVKHRKEFGEKMIAGRSVADDRIEESHLKMALCDDEVDQAAL